MVKRAVEKENTVDSAGGRGGQERPHQEGDIGAMTQSGDIKQCEIS